MSGGQRDRLVGDEGVAREEAHLIEQAVDALDAFGEGGVERGAKFGVAIFFGEQLLMRGERHHGVADFVGEPVGHGLDQAQIGGFDFEPAQLFALRQIVHHEQTEAGSADPAAGTE